MIWATRYRNVRATSSLLIRNTTVVSARPISMSTCWTWPCRNATTPIASSRWRCGWSWRTVCLTERPVGISGETTVYLSPTPPSRTGSRPGGKKAEQHVNGEYLDTVLAEFSGYIAADELYDGPFCVLSIVDNRTFRRITYEVLDHDPTHADIEHFFRRFHSLLTHRGLKARRSAAGSPSSFCGIVRRPRCCRAG